ncbi:hypothetical protein QBC40DRAFT_271093 [Triangularia verruculosa]|uniref:Uncharacterized protein n=1 Tax=Triangularia verruculosa TaxID=2587418 RepID=A0AAN6XXJ8_9PEZI|nr:hypothetical protein QBC40DRAFT_271093 [Triangularia verruculosa]
MVPTSLPRKLLCFLLLIISSISLASARKCYYHKGNVATDLTECDKLKVPESEINVCCRPGDICMRNNLCLHREAKHVDVYYRGGCTVDSWGNADEFCPPMVCLKHEEVWDMLPCDKSGTSWYCKEDYPGPDKASDLRTCKGAVELLLMGFAGGLTEFFGTAIKPQSSSTAKPTETSDEGDPVRTSSKDIDSSTSASPSTDSAADTGPTETSKISSTATEAPATASPTVTPSISPSTAPDNSTGASPPPSPDEPQQNNNSVPIGIGAGVGIAVAIAGSLLAFFYIRKRQREAPIRAESPPPLDPNIQKPDNNYYPFVPYPSAAQQGSISSRNDYLRQPKIPIITESMAPPPQENNVYPGQPRYQPPKRTFSHELP